VHFDKNSVFLLRPVSFFDVRLEMIVVSLATLLAGPIHEALCDQGPVDSPVFHY
jgi:hypothetical protein